MFNFPVVDRVPSFSLYSYRKIISPLTPWNDSSLYSSDFSNMLEQYHLQFRNSYAPGTIELQSLIRQNQFPSRPCSEVSFLISHGNGADGSMGLGALLHLGALHLSLAVGLGRVFLWHSNILGHYSDFETCGELQGLACFLKNPSNCTLEDALSTGADTLHIEKVDAGKVFGFTVDFIPSDVLSILKSWADTPGSQPETPPGAIWGESITKYMWRAQCTAFLMLLNEKTIEDLRLWRLHSVDSPFDEINNLKYEKSELFTNLHQLPHPRLLNISLRQDPFPSFPLQRGTISLHIRHGDKASEMKLVPSIKYFETALKLQHDMSLNLIQQLYVSTEDPLAINELGTTVLSQPQTYGHWIIRYNDLPRSNSNGDLQLQSFASIPRARLTQLWLLQLFMALECDAWVGTRKSNWNRLIDELRCVWVPKCGFPFIEVGPQDLGW